MTTSPWEWEKTMSEVTIGPLVSKLQQLGIDEAKALGAVGGDIRNLRDKLMWMQAFLRDADPRRRVQANEFARVWIKQTRDAGFDAEDAVDQYDLRVDLSRYGSWARAVVQFFAGFTTQVYLRHKLSTRIKSINVRLDNISANKGKFGTKEGTTTEPAALPWRASTTISAAANTNLRGDFVLPPPVNRAEDVDELYAKLRTPNPHRVVIYVTGQSGVGKTTLVKEVYEKLRTNNHFVVPEWSSIPPDMSVASIRKLITQNLQDTQDLKQEKEAKASEKSKDEASEKLNEKLRKKYLLVIDGEITNSRWNHILDALPDTEDSKLVRITQGSAQVLHDKYQQSCIEVKVRPLDEKATTELFCQRVCKAEYGEKYNKDVRTCVENKYQKVIYHVTEGLPLAIVLLSGLVRTKNPVEWKAVFEHLKSKQLKRLDAIFSLCFDDLPYDIKSCFLYFAALPANMPIEARELIYMWMAEGFLRSEDGMTMEKVGQRYMQELIDRYLVSLSPTADDDATPGDEKVIIHSKVNAFLQTEAQEASFMDIHTSDETPSLVTSRRLSLRNYSGRYTALVNPMPKLRSIFCSFEEDDTGHETDTESECSKQCLPSFQCRQQPNKEESIKRSIKQLLRKSKFLRVIHLEGLDMDKNLPDEIGNVMHLQYLAITSTWSLETIPRSIGNIRNLQTLDVRFTSVSKLPTEFWKMRTLRHVLGHGLILPKKVGNLEHLQTLESVVPDKKGWDKCTFENMIRLQTLEIWELPVLQSKQKDENASAEKPSESDQNGEISPRQESSAVVQSKSKEIIEKALTSVLRKLDQLRKLTLYCKFTMPLKVFSRASSPLFPNLEVVELHGNLNLPTDMEDTDIKLCLPNLLHLSLEETEVPLWFFKRLAADLSFLENLNLDSGAYREEDLVFPPGGFQSLKKLTISLRRPLKTVQIGSLALTSLEDLKIAYYPANSEVHLKIDGKDNIVKKIKNENKELDGKINSPDSAE